MQLSRNRLLRSVEEPFNATHPDAGGVVRPARRMWRRFDRRMSAPREAAQAAKAAGAAASPLAIPSGPLVEKVNRVDPRLRGAKGKVDVWVSLNEPALAARKRELRPLGHDEAWRATDEATRAQMHAHRQQLAGGQDALAGALASLGARELGRVSRAHNAVAVRIDASRLQQLSALSGVPP